MSQTTISASRIRANMSWRMLPDSTISPVVPPSSLTALSAGSMRSVWTRLKSISRPDRSFFLPNGRMMNARCTEVPSLPLTALLCAALTSRTRIQDCAVFELDYVDVDGPGLASDLYHMRRSSLRVPDGASVPDCDQRDFRCSGAQSQLEHPAIAALPLVCSCAMQPSR